MYTELVYLSTIGAMAPSIEKCETYITKELSFKKVMILLDPECLSIIIIKIKLIESPQKKSEYVFINCSIIPILFMAYFL